MQIRPYVDGDYEQLETILRETGLFLEDVDTRETLQRQSTFDNDSILIAEEKGDLIGGVFLLYSPWSSTIRHLFVHPNYQRRGIGAELLLAAEKILENKGARTVSIYVNQADAKRITFFKNRKWKEYPLVVPLHKENK